MNHEHSSHFYYVIIYFSFSTLEPNGLLLYNGRFNHKHDYFAVEIINGQVQLNFSTGQVFSVVNPYIQGGVNDGLWHTILINYQNKVNLNLINFIVVIVCYSTMPNCQVYCSLYRIDSTWVKYYPVNK